MNNKPFSSFIPINIQTQGQLKRNNSGEKKTHLCLQCPINIAEWEDSICYALLYTDTLRLLDFSSMHCVMGNHDNSPKQAHEGGQMFSHDWNRIVQAMDATENKTDGKSQAIATWDLDTRDD